MPFHPDCHFYVQISPRKKLNVGSSVAFFSGREITTDMILNVSLVPASEILAQTVDTIAETAEAAKDVLVEKESFAELSSYLEKIIPVLKELTKKNINNPEILNNAVETLNREIKAAKQLVLECKKRNKVYLLVNCRSIVKRLEKSTREISRALGLIPLASLDLSSRVNEEIKKLCDKMLTAEFRAAVSEEEIMEKIESGIQERNVDRSYANNLMILIAKALGISTETSALKKEFEEFKTEIEDTQVRKDQAEAIQMDQIIALLGRADATSSPGEKERKYFTKRNSLGNQPLEPLQSFYCPITHDVMVDPVETSSGQTFERSAIEKWFADGNTLCPLSRIPLDTLILRPNKTLRQSIEEWKDRNTMITIASMKPKLQSVDEQEVLHSLDQLHDLCKERDLHREWVTLENYIPILIELLPAKNREIRVHVLVILCILAKDSDDTKERIAKVENAIEAIVRSLARHMDESKIAVALLLELSKSDIVCHCIGKVKGCILLLVTMLSSDDTQAAKYAKELLEDLSFLDQNVIQMAKANHFKPLLQRLSSGPENVKTIMATTLAEMELSDHNKLTLFEDGVLKPLLHLVSSGDAEMKKVAVKALKNLSTLPRNGFQMIQEGAVCLLLDLLYSHGTPPSLREQAASTIMNIAVSTTAQEARQTEVPLLESDEDIFRLLSLITMTAPNIQQSLLRTFKAMCQGPSAKDIRSKLRQCSAIPVLVQLCEVDNIGIRADALKLFCCLTEDGDDGSLSEHVDQRCIGTLIRRIKDSHDKEEITAAMGIISNLPMGPTQITQWLLDADALVIISKLLNVGNSNSTHTNNLIENAVGAMRHFTISTNMEWQKRAAEAGIIPVLVRLLGSGTALTKQHAAFSLAQFSESSVRLSRPIHRRGGFRCFSPPPEAGCPVHMGICTVESSFCLVEAEAVQPLVTVLGESNFGASNAALNALLTLIDGERLQSGSKVLDEANAIIPIINLLSSPYTELQEKSLCALERIFRLMEFKQKYGALAHMHLVDLTQRGNSTMKSLAARILAHLNVLHEASSYF